MDEAVMVYGVFSGEYSDWEVHGYFDNEKDAKAYCEEKNGGYNKYYVLPLINLKDGDPEVYRGYAYNCLYDTVFELEKVSAEKRETSVELMKNGRYGIERCLAYVWLKPRDFSEEKVRKIGQDAIAKYKAKKEGIT